MRESRKTKSTEIDLTKPIIDVFSFGSKDDPCFGKLYSPSAKECNRCGDNELCIIAMAQKAKTKRAKIKEKAPLKDEEEVSIEVNNALKNFVITNKIKLFIKVAKLIQKKFGLETLEESKALIRATISELKTFKIKKINGKRFLTPIK